MKPTFILATIAPLLPGLSEALVAVTWKASNVPSTGLKDITFPISVRNAPHEEGFYFAQQFGFTGLKDVGYTGLQPRPDSAGTPIIHATFSSFASGTTTDDSNCSSGADGGAGISCSVDVAARYDQPYNLVVKNIGGDSWLGTLVNAATNKTTHIGSYTLPSGAGGIADYQVGFVEYYPWNSQKDHSCASLPYTNVTFGVPMSTHASVRGSLEEPYENGDCIGKVNFDVQKMYKSAYQVSVGF